MRAYARIAMGSAACGLLLQVGCQTVTPESTAATPGQRPAASVPANAATPTLTVPTVGRLIQPVITAAKTANARCQFFAPDSTPLDSFPEGRAGSISIHLADRPGQDNYAFDARGVVTRHQRSYGANYDAGVWEDAP